MNEEFIPRCQIACEAAQKIMTHVYLRRWRIDGKAFVFTRDFVVATHLNEPPPLIPLSDDGLPF